MFYLCSKYFKSKFYKFNHSISGTNRLSIYSQEPSGYFIHISLAYCFLFISFFWGFCCCWMFFLSFFVCLAYPFVFFYVCFPMLFCLLSFDYKGWLVLSLSKSLAFSKCFQSFVWWRRETPKGNKGKVPISSRLLENGKLLRRL